MWRSSVCACGETPSDEDFCPNCERLALIEESLIDVDPDPHAEIEIDPMPDGWDIPSADLDRES